MDDLAGGSVSALPMVPAKPRRGAANRVPLDALDERLSAWAVRFAIAAGAASTFYTYGVSLGWFDQARWLVR